MKFPGGKTRLLLEIQALLPANFSELFYFEPFIGGGALFFAKAPKQAFISDINADLIHAYAAVRDDIDGLIRELTWLKAEHCEAAYYEIRDIFNTQSFENKTLRAAVVIYLGKTAFNGMQRRNKKGEFNVPIGSYTDPNICDEKTLRRCHEVLKGENIAIGCDTFATVCDHPGEGDFVYLDPPYDVPEGTNNFTAYSAEGFSFGEQRMLSEKFFEMHERGAKLLLSNSDTAFVRALYSGFEIVSIEAPRSVGAKTRKSAAEVLIRNY